VISGLREVLSKFQFDIPVSNSGKYKAALQIISIGCLIFSDIDFFKNLTLDFNIMKFTGLCLLWIASFLSITSGLGYVNQAIQFLKKNR
jgi:phosphatidylglycerophosphate synthase